MASALHHRRAAPSECPVCGADVPRGAHACPECGADERAGWNEESTRYDGLDLPDEAWEDEGSAHTRRALKPTSSRIWQLLAALLIAALIAALFGLAR